MIKLSFHPLANTLVSLLGINFLISGLSFVTTLSIAVVLGSTEFGVFSYALALGGYLTTIAFYGMEQTLVRDLAQHPDRFDEHLSASFLVRGIMMAVALLLLAVGNIFAEGDSKLTLIGLLLVLLDGVKSFYISQVYDVWGRMERHAVYYLVERIIYFAIIWGAIFFAPSHFSLLVIAVAMALSTIVSFIMQYAWALPKLRLRLNPQVWTVAKAMARNNFWIWLALLSTLSFGGLSKLVLQYVSGSSQLGQYSVAWQIVALGSLVVAQTARIGYPRMARAVQAGTRDPGTTTFLVRYFVFSTAATAVVGLPAILFPSLLLQALGPEYAGAAEPLRLLGVYVILLGAGQVGLQFLISTKREGLYAAITILTGALSPLFYVFLVPLWSAFGAALAVVLAHGLAITIYTWIMVRDVFFPGPTASGQAPL